VSIRLAGTDSLQSAALTTPGALNQFANSLKRVGTLLYPAGKKFLEKTIDTEYGPIVFTMGDMGGVKDYVQNIGTISKLHGLVTHNPQVLNSLQQLGYNLKGIGNIAFGWHESTGYDPLKGPGNIGYTGTKNIKKAISQAFHREIIPDLLHANPGSNLWVSNEPTTASRARSYASDKLPGGRAMGPLDPTGTQNALILPSGKLAPFELIGRGIPHNLLMKGQKYDDRPELIG
tara:strand:+ start:159 stop:854 length:696 start_codon:yes stop_codon:yes gene_type:complete